MTRFLCLFAALCAIVLLARPALADDAPVAHSAGVPSLGDSSAPAADAAADNPYVQVDVDINGYENYTIGHAVSEYFAAEDLAAYRSSDSDSEFGYYDVGMTSDDGDYVISLGTYEGDATVGSVSMYMDPKYGDKTFYTVKDQLDGVVGYELPLTAHSTVVGGVQLWMEDSEGDTLELMYVPANDKNVEAGTFVYVTGVTYLDALLQSIINAQPAESAAPTS